MTNNLEYNPATCNIESHDNIIVNPDRPWEQVLWFLKKKQDKIDSLEEYFWKEPFGIIFYLEQAFMRSKEKELKIPMKKSESNLNYDIIEIKKEVDEENEEPTEYIQWYENNEPVTKEYLKEKWEEKDIVTFENNLISLFEKLHIDREKLFEDFDNTQSYLKAELNTYGFSFQSSTNSDNSGNS